MMRYVKVFGAVLLAMTLVLAWGCAKKKEEKKEEKKAEEPAKPEPRPREEPREPEKPAEPAVEKESKTAEAVLGETKGTVEIRKSGEDEFKAAKKDDELFPGDAVRAGKDGEVTLAYWDHSSVELTPESAVSLGNSAAVANPTPSVTVMAGAVRLDVPARTEGQGPFMVYTPSSAAAVQGTVLAIGVGLSGSSRVAVEEGKVEVTPVVKVGGKAILVPAGKAVVVPLGKGAGGLAKYDANNADWDQWLEADGKKAAANADAVAKAHAEMVEKLKKEEEALEGAEDQTEANAAELEKKVAAAEKAAKAADYKAVQPKMEENVDALRAINHNARFINGRVVAHAYLLGLLHGRASAGVYKVPPAKMKVVAARLAAAGKIIPDYWARARRRRLRRLRRLRRMRRWYYLHHSKGRMHAKKIGYKVPKFYAALKLRRRMRRRRVRIAGYRGPVFVRPRYRGKVIRGRILRQRARNWHRHARWVQLQKQRRARTAARRAAWRKAVIARRMKRWRKRPKVRRHRWGIRRRIIRRRPGVRRPLRPGLRRPLRPGERRPLRPGLRRPLRPGERRPLGPGMRPLRPGVRRPLRGMRPPLRGMRGRGLRKPLRKPLRRRLRRRRGPEARPK